MNSKNLIKSLFWIRIATFALVVIGTIIILASASINYTNSFSFSTIITTSVYLIILFVALSITNLVIGILLIITNKDAEKYKAKGIVLATGIISLIEGAIGFLFIIPGILFINFGLFIASFVLVSVSFTKICTKKQENKNKSKNEQEELDKNIDDETLTIE